MKPEHRIILRKLYKKLVEDVNSIDVVPQLIQDGVLDFDDGDSINCLRSPRAQMQKLLNMLPLRGPEAYEKFSSALRENYPWIADQLETPDGLSEVDARPILKDLGDLEVDEDVIEIIRKNSQVMKRWSTLAHGLEMSSAKTQIQIQANIFMWDLDQCVVTLIEKWKAAKGKHATIGNLIKVLRKEDFNDVADSLQDKYSRI